MHANHQGTKGEEPGQTPLVSLVLVAEFDIEQGGIMKAQYPREIVSPPPSEFISGSLSYCDLVANIMLPDGAQRQEWDYNYFLLHRPKTPLSKEVTDEWELLESQETSTSISLSSLMTPDASYPPNNTLFALNCVTCTRNSAASRGATVLAVSILSEFPSVCLSDGQATGMIPLLRKFLVVALENPQFTVDLMTQLYTKLNSMECYEHYRILSSIPDIRYSTKPFFLQSSVTFQKEDFALCLPVDSFSRAFSAGSILALIRRFGFIGVLQIFHAILAEHNILFVGYGIPSNVLCNIVISCSLLAPLDSLLTERIFPYVSLNDLTFTQTNGFIAGTNNPVLQNSCTVDLLIDLETNTIERVTEETMATKKRHKIHKFGKNILEETSKFFQAEFLQYDIFRKHLEMGILQLRCGETWVRRQFIEKTTLITEISVGCPEIPHNLISSYQKIAQIIKPTQWFKKEVNKMEAQPTIIRRINSALRHIWYPLHGYYNAKERVIYICPALEQLIQIVEDDFTLLLVAQRLIYYFGDVDLSDAIEFIPSDSDGLMESARRLNVKLLALYSDNKILLSLQSSTFEK